MVLNCSCTVSFSYAVNLYINESSVDAVEIAVADRNLKSYDHQGVRD